MFKDVVYLLGEYLISMLICGEWVGEIALKEVAASQAKKKRGRTKQRLVESAVSANSLYCNSY